MGVAYHAEYLVWFEVGRTEWLRTKGSGSAPRSYRDLEELGYFLPVVEVSARYHSPARYDDELVVVTRLGDATRVRLVFVYEVWRREVWRRDARGHENGHPLSTGRTVHAVTDGAGRPRRLPPELLAGIVGPPLTPFH